MYATTTITHAPTTITTTTANITATRTTAFVATFATAEDIKVKSWGNVEGKVERKQYILLQLILQLLLLMVLQLLLPLQRILRLGALSRNFEGVVNFNQKTLWAYKLSNSLFRNTTATAYSIQLKIQGLDDRYVQQTKRQYIANGFCTIAATVSTMTTSSKTPTTITVITATTKAKVWRWKFQELLWCGELNWIKIYCMHESCQKSVWVIY